MIMQDKKRPVSLILDMMKSPMMRETSKNEMGDEVSGDDAMDAAARSILSAIETKDVKAIKSSFKAMFELLSEVEPYEEAETAE